ncbi:MAG: hypothetical protein Q9160_000359 [Pyrenula sp. 1 TL-2023]
MPFHYEIAEAILQTANIRISQSQLIVKSRRTGSSIVPHQDGCLNFTDSARALTFWYALEDATIDNGCLEVAPGSHRTTPLTERLVKGEKGVPKTVGLDNPVWAPEADSQSRDAWARKEGKMDREATLFTPLEVNKGSLIVFHGCLLHRSKRNSSEMGRMAYTFSVLDGNSDIPLDSYLLPPDGKYEPLQAGADK